MSERKFAGRVCLITGAGSGIGRATALLLGRCGAIVIATDINRPSAEGVAKEIASGGGAAEGVALDVSDAEMWRSVVEGVVAKHGRLDALVNNAGVSNVRPIADSTIEDWRALMSVNLDGVFLGTQAAMTAMKEGGSIVNVASVAGMKPFGGAAAYCASKAAVRIFTKTAAIECADAESGIRVNLVTPGGVKTPIWDNHAFFRDLTSQWGGRDAAFAMMSQGKASMAFFEPEEVAETICYLVSDDARHLSGTEIVMDRGQS